MSRNRRTIMAVPAWKPPIVRPRLMDLRHEYVADLEDEIAGAPVANGDPVR